METGSRTYRNRMKRIKTLMGLAVVALSLLLPVGASAQQVGVKTNLLIDATASPNLGIEVGLARKFTLDVSGNLNLWDWDYLDNMKWKHWVVQPELRYWTCQRFAGHFFGLHALAGQFNFGNFHFFGHPVPDSFQFLGTDYSLLSKYRYEGWAFGGGLGYGYAVPLGKHWNMELELGLGAIYSIADSFECDYCNRPVDKDIRHLRPAITKAAFSFVYLF